MKTIPVAQYGNPPQPQYRLRQGAKKNSGCGSYLSGIFTLLVLGGAAVYLFVFDGYDQVLQLLGVGPTPAPTRRPTASPVPTVPTFKPTPLPTNVRGRFVFVLFHGLPVPTSFVPLATIFRLFSQIRAERLQLQLKHFIMLVGAGRTFYRDPSFNRSLLRPAPSIQSATTS